MQACEGLVCGKFSILLLMVFRRTLWAGWWVLRRALRRVFSGRGLVGVDCGGGLVGVEVPPPPSLEDPTDTSFSSTAQLNQTDQCNGSVQFHGQAWQCKKI